MANQGELRNKFSTLALEQVRENVRRTIMSYRSSWDLYTEMVQNAVDAIIDKYGYENIKMGNIRLSFNTGQRELYIEDNGIGIKPEDISSILVMGESLKRKENRGKFGFMGYGFTFVAFQTSYLRIESVHEGRKASRTYKDLYKFVFEHGELPLSEEEKNQVRPEETGEESYTKITLSFPQVFPDETLENNIKSAFLQTTSKDMFEYILRTKSAVGIVDKVFNENLELFNIQIEVNGEEVSINPGYLTTKEMIKNMYPAGLTYDIDTYTKFIQQTEHLSKDAKKAARQALLIDGKFSNIILGDINPLKLNIYITETSKDHLREYNKKFPNHEDIEKIDIQNGIWLAIDGLPTGICLDSLSHGSYLPFTVIVDVNKEIRNELDSGRKGITAYRAGRIVEKVKAILKDNKFIEYREFVLGVDTRVNTDGYDARRELRDKLAKKSYHNIGLMQKYYPVDNEQEVITLFTELISTGLLPGYFQKVVSGFQVYDGLYDYKCDFKDEILLDNDPLGIAASVKRQHSEIDKEIVIEFKKYLKSIFTDLFQAKKRLQDIDILVCWDVEYERKDEYVEDHGVVLKEVDQSENYYYGVTHAFMGLGRNTNFLPVIELKTVLNKIFNLSL